MEIKDMTVEQLEQAIAEKQAEAAELKEKRLKLEPAFLKLTRQTLVMKKRGNMSECERLKAESHALSERMTGMHEKEVEAEDFILEAKERIAELNEG